MAGGGLGENGNYDSERLSAACATGEKAISGWTHWLPLPDDLELWTGELKPIISAENSVIGFTARAGNDSDTAHTFQIYVLCYAG